MTDTTTLLLVEDDLGLRTFLADNLTADGFDVLLADTVRDDRGADDFVCKPCSRGELRVWN